MKTTTLLIEFLIIGFLSSIIIFLCYALFYTVNFDTLWKILNESKGYGAVVTTITFYALGAIIHRLIEIFFGHVINPKDKNKDKTRMLNVLQNGSDSLNNRLVYELSLMRMFASFSILMPVIGIMYFALDCKTEDIHSGTFVLFLSLIIMIASIGCYIAQRNSINLIIDTFNNINNK